MLRLVINLDRSPDRWTSVKNQLCKINSDAQRVPAVDGKALDPHFIEKIQPPLHKKWRFPRTLSPGEVGCYLSHIKCWEQLLSSNEKWALIIEDDILILNSAKPFFENANWIPPGIDLIQPFIFFPQTVKIKKNSQHTVLDRSLVIQVKPSSVGTLAYFISRTAAEDALENSQRLFMPVDEFLFGSTSSWASRHPVWKLCPAVAAPKGFNSTIQAPQNKDLPYSRLAKYSPLRSITRIRNSIFRALTTKSIYLDVS